MNPHMHPLKCFTYHTEHKRAYSVNMVKVYSINHTNFVSRSYHTNDHPVWPINLRSVTLHILKVLITGKFEFLKAQSKQYQ